MSLSASLQLNFQASAALSAAVLLLHATAALCAGFFLQPAPLGFTLAGLVLSCAAHWRGVRLRAPQSLRGLQWDKEGLRLTTADGKVQQAEFLGGAVPATALALLQVRYPGGRRTHILIAADAVQNRAFRLLRMWLRWHPRHDAQKGK